MLRIFGALISSDALRDLFEFARPSKPRTGYDSRTAQGARSMINALFSATGTLAECLQGG